MWKPGALNHWRTDHRAGREVDGADSCMLPLIRVSFGDSVDWLCDLTGPLTHTLWLSGTCGVPKARSVLRAAGRAERQEDGEAPGGHQGAERAGPSHRRPEVGVTAPARVPSPRSRVVGQ